jgi:hypothetical protein
MGFIHFYQKWLVVTLNFINVTLIIDSISENCNFMKNLAAYKNISCNNQQTEPLNKIDQKKPKEN